MDSTKTLYDLGYFGSREEAERSLAIFADEKRPLLLPENQVLCEVAQNLIASARENSLTAKEVLIAYQRLRESHFHTDVFCGWKKSSGSPCGGHMDIDVDAAGAYYRCRIDPTHRTPK